MLTGLLALALLAAPAPAVTAAAAPAPMRRNCDAAAEYHQLDFWIGDWDTFELDNPRGGPSVARAHVDPIAQGCAIHELYEQVDGLIGDSILSYDPARKQWQQTWVTNGGSIMEIFGNFKDGALVLEGEVHLRDGRSVLQRISWKAQDQGVSRVGGAVERRRQDLGAFVRRVVPEACLDKAGNPRRRGDRFHALDPCRQDRRRHDGRAGRTY